MKEVTIKLSSEKFSETLNFSGREKSIGKGTGRKDIGLLPA